MTRREALLCVLCACSLASASAHEFAARHLRVEHPWVEPAAAHSDSAPVHFEIHNDGKEDDVLTAVATTAGLARGASIVAAIAPDGASDNARSESSVALRVPAGGRVSPGPGDTQVVLDGLRVALTPGMRFPLFLTFAEGGTLEVEVWVENAAAHRAHAHEAH